MRLEWLEDILAVLQTGSFIRAAEQRFLTQPAFSRRIKLIENYVGVELFDRSRKPAKLKQSVIDQQQNIQELVVRLSDLRDQLKHQDHASQNRIVIASQHAITTSVLSTLVKKLSNNLQLNIVLRSANRDECYGLLMTRQTDLILIHQSSDEQFTAQGGFLEQCNLGQERFIPVYASAELHKLNEDYANGVVNVVAYPDDAFLGQVMNRDIFPCIRDANRIRKKAETALTFAALQLALAGVGVAWLPHSLAVTDLASNRLTDLSQLLPSCELTVAAIRLNDSKSSAKDLVWGVVSSIKNWHPE